MIYGHILETEKDGVKKYILVIREFVEFESLGDRDDLVPLIRITICEPGGDRGLLLAHVSHWAKLQGITIDGMESPIGYLKQDQRSRIRSLEHRMFQMAAFLQKQQDVAEPLGPALNHSIVEYSECCRRLEELEMIVMSAQKRGCTHIDNAVFELKSCDTKGH